MSGDMVVSPKAIARAVVTMPPEPSRLADALAADIASEYVALARTTDAFTHLARLALEHFSIMIPFIDSVGAGWAADLFESTTASECVLVLRDAYQLLSCGAAGRRIEASTTRIIDYAGADLTKETFHAKIVLVESRADRRLMRLSIGWFISARVEVTGTFGGLEDNDELADEVCPYDYYREVCGLTGKWRPSPLEAGAYRLARKILENCSAVTCPPAVPRS